MQGLNNLKKRLNYFGGDAEGRLQQDKLRGLKRSLFNSYQACTAVLEDEREFKCLINPNKNSPEYDNKILSIPYEDICLNPQVSEYKKTSEGLEKIDLKCGETFTWKETGTHWLVYLQYLEEDAYFRAQIRRCDQQVEINRQRYWVYIRGPVETSVTWNQKAGVEWNDLNYSLVMYITRDKNTLDFFHRFQKVKIIEPDSNRQKTWQVVGRDPYYGDGMIQVFLDEYFENRIADMAEAEKKAAAGENVGIDATQPYIEGQNRVKKYDTITYTAKNFTDLGTWYLKDGDLEEIEIGSDTEQISLDVIGNATNTFVITYRNGNEEASMTVVIETL